MKIKVTIFLAVAAGVLSPAAYACGKNHYRDGFGLCIPRAERLPDIIIDTTQSVLQSIEQAVREAMIAGPGEALTVYIRESRNSAIGTAQPIPPHIRTQLQGFVAESTLDRVRYKVGDNGLINLGGVTVRYGDASAITLDELVVFADQSGAEDLALWVHELYHVEQFAGWGVRDFAIKYVRDHGAIERPAYARANEYLSWASRTLDPSRPIGRGSDTPIGRSGAGVSAPAGGYDAPTVALSPSMLLGTWNLTWHDSGGQFHSAKATFINGVRGLTAYLNVQSKWGEAVEQSDVFIQGNRLFLDNTVVLSYNGSGSYAADAFTLDLVGGRFVGQTVDARGSGGRANMAR